MARRPARSGRADPARAGAWQPRRNHRRPSPTAAVPKAARPGRLALPALERKPPDPRRTQDERGPLGRDQPGVQELGQVVRVLKDGTGVRVCQGGAVKWVKEFARQIRARGIRVEHLAEARDRADERRHVQCPGDEAAIDHGLDRDAVQDDGATPRIKRASCQMVRASRTSEVPVRSNAIGWNGRPWRRNTGTAASG